MIKTVYGPPPADEERIESTDLEVESSFREEGEIPEATPAAKHSAGKRR